MVAIYFLISLLVLVLEFFIYRKEETNKGVKRI